MNPFSLFQLPQFIRSQVRNIVLGLVSGICVLTGIGFLLSALWMWLAPQFGSIWASVMIGAGMLLLSAIGLLIKDDADKPDEEREPAIDGDSKLSLKTIAQLEAGKADAVATLVDAFVLGASTYRDIRSGR